MVDTLMSNQTMLHELDCRLKGIEQWKLDMISEDLPAIRATIEQEIPEHYTNKIAESEKITDLKIQNAINSMVIRVLFGASCLLVIQSVIEKLIGV
jgi:hypothetical protein